MLILLGRSESNMKQIEIVIRYEGEGADSGQLNLYDGARSYYGLARVINLITHAFANNDEVRKKLTKPENATTTLGPAKKGCFEQTIIVSLAQKVVDKIGLSVINSHYWDYLAYALATATDQQYAPQSSYLKKLLKDIDKEIAFDELAEVLEKPLQYTLRPVSSHSATTVSFVRPKVGEILTMDQRTFEYVNTNDVEENSIDLEGNITRYNILSGYGRAYIDQFKRTVPFSIDNFENNRIAHAAATSSMNAGVENATLGKRRLKVQRVVNATGNVKRLIMKEINPLLDEDL